MNILFIGDIFGEPGRRAVKTLLPKIRQDYALDFVIANGENMAHGKGVTVKTAKEIFSAGVDVITTGNHAFDQEDSHAYYQTQTRLLRPANYDESTPGRGYCVVKVLNDIDLAVINLIGRIHMEPANCPFSSSDKILAELRGRADIIFVDMHAETTSETRAMGWYLNGKVAAVVGSHTHVPTADEEILTEGTGYLTDAGMTGPYRSVIGMKIDPVLKKFRTGLKTRFEPARDDIRLCAVMVQIEESTGKATRIERVQRKLEAM